MNRVPEEVLERRCLRFDVQEIGKRWFCRPMPRGQREKYELRPLDVVPPIGGWQWFWKSSIARAPLEFWSEVIAYHVGGIVGVSVPPCFPSRFEGKWGVLTLSFLSDANESHIDGGDLLAAVDAEYDRSYGQRQSIQLIYNALEQVDLSSEKTVFFEILVLDALIGNQDRHHENWGAIVGARQQTAKSSTVTFRIAPAFDNGASLLKELRTDDELAARLGTEQLLTAYASRGLSEVRWQKEAEAVRLSHFDFLKLHLQNFPWARNITETLLNYDSAAIYRVLQRLQRLSLECDSMVLTEYRIERLERLLEHRKQRILGLL